MNEVPLEKFIKHYPKSEVVFEENSAGADMFIVHSGRVRLSTRGERGEHVMLATVERGGFFGEMSLIDKSPRSATAVAEDDTRLIVLDRPKFLYMIQQQPMFALTIMRVLCRRIRDANAMIASSKHERMSSGS